MLASNRLMSNMLLNKGNIFTSGNIKGIYFYIYIYDNIPFLICTLKTSSFLIVSIVPQLDLLENNNIFNRIIFELE